jgi:hypothetical protein
MRFDLLQACTVSVKHEHVTRTARSDSYTKAVQGFLDLLEAVLRPLGFWDTSLMAAAAPDRRLPLARRRSVRALPEVKPSLSVTEARALSLAVDFLLVIILRLQRCAYTDNGQRPAITSVRPFLACCSMSEIGYGC